MTQLRKRNKSLGLAELIAIAICGMVDEGIFKILGISLSMTEILTPIAFVWIYLILGIGTRQFSKHISKQIY